MKNSVNESDIKKIAIVTQKNDNRWCGKGTGSYA